MNNSKEIFDCYANIRDELIGKDIEAIMRGKHWAQLMRLMSDHFNTISIGAQSESDIATKMDASILAFSDNVMEPSGLQGFTLDKERNYYINTLHQCSNAGCFLSFIENLHGGTMPRLNLSTKWFII